MKKTIEITVVQAENLDPFTMNGKRNLNFHFFHLSESGWIFHWIQEDTDVTWLTEKITQGVIYIFEE